MKYFTASSDPEVFLVNKEGKHISSIDKIGGSKWDPMPTEHGHVQEDNVALEFNPRPASSLAEFIKNHSLMLRDINTLIEPLDLRIDITPTALFDPDQLEHPGAMTAGCAPDWNAWTGEQNDPPDLSTTQLRSGGGHLHIGWEAPPDNEDGEGARQTIMRMMDITAGIPSVLMDDNTQRRSLYGLAGCYRPKYTEFGDIYDGSEYRSLSNFWLRSKDLMTWAYKSIESAFAREEEFNALISDGAINQDMIVRCINTSDKKMAEALCKQLNLMVV